MYLAYRSPEDRYVCILLIGVQRISTVCVSS